MVGSRVLAEATGRGHHVLALSRTPAPTDAAEVTPVEADLGTPHTLGKVLAAATAERPLDALVLAVRTFPADEAFLTDATRAVLDAAAALGTRVLVVGGAGALLSPSAPGLRVADDPAYVPPGWRAVAAAGIAQLETCRAHAHQDWTYLSPPANLAPGDRTGRYRCGTDTLLTEADGSSWISAEDLATAVVDELENPGAGRMFTVAHQSA
ncbi:NAD(P)H-binding protein [Streptomyces sp. NPDC089919]|uniref:NAD(P)-dependent oxidoreductase n=1 Tax=Streptomyces sp. NPDC089919 TaxID=3155188 RepID=UPI00342CE65D